ncbi:MAG: hypothetical protein ACKOEG_07340 [Chthoniobacterales bacterium]
MRRSGDVRAKAFSPADRASVFRALVRILRRITLPDGSLLTIPVVDTRSTGLRAKLTPAITQHIRLQRESGNKDGAA